MNPPETRCQYQGMENMGLDWLPMRLSRVAKEIIPMRQPNIKRKLAIFVTSRKRAEKRMARVEVSPMDPGTSPMKASNQEKSETDSIPLMAD